MIIWNGKDLVGFGILLFLFVALLGAVVAEKIMFWLEKKKLITDKWRLK